MESRECKVQPDDSPHVSGGHLPHAVLHGRELMLTDGASLLLCFRMASESVDPVNAMLC